MNEQGVYLDKWIIDLLPIDEKAFRVAVFLVRNVGADGKTRTTYAEIARGTGMTYENARGAIERMYNSQSLSQAIPNHFPITRQSHGLSFDINIKGNGIDGQFPIISQSLPNHFPITFPNTAETVQQPIISTLEPSVALDSINNSLVPSDKLPSKSNFSSKETNSPKIEELSCPPCKEKYEITPENKALENGEEKAGEAPKIKRFVKPTPEQVQAYCDERKNGIDGHDFWDFYESKGWVIGKSSPMRDWRAAVRTWERGRNAPTKRSTRTFEEEQQSLFETAELLRQGNFTLFGASKN